MVNLTFDPRSPEVEAGIERLVALFFIQPSEGIFGKAALHEPVQVAVPFDLDADDTTLWSTEETQISDVLIPFTLVKVEILLILQCKNTPVRK